jgi:Phosphopentomutase
MKTGALLVYTSADSVFQIAAHEDIVPIEKLYEYCEIARKMLKGKDAVGRVIARPFVGSNRSDFKRTSNRHDFSLKPPRETILIKLQKKGYDTISIGKIYDIFDGEGIDVAYKTSSNKEGMEETIRIAQEDFAGLCFTNLVDFDMKYGHRNDIDGYAKAMTEFGEQLGGFLPLLQKDDILIITADHGCDPGTPSTDHSREYVPFLIYGENIRPNVNLGIRKSFGTVANTIAEYFEIDAASLNGESVLLEVIK